MKSNYLHIIFLFISAFLQAQVLDELIVKADSLYDTTKHALNFPEKSTLHKSPFNFYLRDDNTVNKYQIELKELEAEQYKNDIGLVFKANTNYNFRDAFDEEANSFNKLRVRTELEWNLLKNGFVNNRYKAEQKLNEAQYLRQLDTKYKKQLWRRQFRINYNYISNIEALGLFKSFLKFENEYFDFLHKLYAVKLIKRERLIRVSNHIYILENQIKVLKKENLLLKDSVSKKELHINTLPIFSLNIDSISVAKERYNTICLQENVVLKHKRLSNLNLSVYVNQNFNHSLTKNQYFPSVGIRFRAPIRFNKRAQIIKAKVKLLKAQEKDKKTGQYNRMITYLGGYNEKLKDLQNQHKNWKVVEERIRILKVLKSEFASKETGLLILELVEEQFKILENIIQLKRQLYTVISHLFELHPSENLKDIVKPYAFKKIQVKSKLLFVKSNKYSMNLQFEFMKSKSNYSIQVLQDDFEIQKYLRNKKTPFTIAKKRGTIITIETLIDEEIKKIRP